MAEDNWSEFKTNVALHGATTKQKDPDFGLGVSRDAAQENATFDQSQIEAYKREYHERVRQEKLARENARQQELISRIQAQAAKQFGSEAGQEVEADNAPS